MAHNAMPFEQMPARVGDWWWILLAGRSPGRRRTGKSKDKEGQQYDFENEISARVLQDCGEPSASLHAAAVAVNRAKQKRN
jgi:hypothetical protein